MNGNTGYAVFFFPQALEALGEAIKPYLTDQPDGPHIFCKEIDTGGAFTEMTLVGKNAEGHDVQVELMVPGSMIRMIVSAQNESLFGFGPRASAVGTQVGT
ncbi:MAG: hypothetical protein C0521_06070 [Xanthomonas sp.]|jgi:hypothetical protein|uniref:hypothetical protein n=1 Tax=Pseudoxanthomonas mexicana TaxID=128785 RepID=UPI000783E168|nr:hypothetical protein [Pseudoxanthomonas mexicana]MBA3929143.1 hypothetical protein [Xanthomonas sp.]MBL8256399.1 hypothetical protein [Pseudoxanthomonas mexicana]